MSLAMLDSAGVCWRLQSPDEQETSLESIRWGPVRYIAISGAVSGAISHIDRSLLYEI